MAIYFLAAVTRENLEPYKVYEQRGFEAVAKFGVNALAVSDDITVLEGERPAERLVLLRFETQEELDKWYFSEEYQSVIPIRQANADTKYCVTFPGLD